MVSYKYYRKKYQIALIEKDKLEFIAYLFDNLNDYVAIANITKKSAMSSIHKVFIGTRKHLNLNHVKYNVEFIEVVDDEL